MLGKLNMDEFAMGPPRENSHYQATKNPRDLTRVPAAAPAGWRPAWRPKRRPTPSARIPAAPSASRRRSAGGGHEANHGAVSGTA